MEASDLSRSLEEILKKYTKILIVEDDKSLTDVLKDELADHGYRTEIAQNATEAQKLILKEIYDLVLIDILLPDLLGDQLVLNLLDRLSNSNVIITSIWDEHRIRAKRTFKDLKYPVIKKEECLSYLINVLNKILKEKKKTILPRIDAIIKIARKSKHEEIIYDASEIEEVKKIQEIFKRWLDKLSDKKEKYILYDGEYLSPEDIIKELEKGSEIGKEHFNMFLDFLDELMKK